MDVREKKHVTIWARKAPRATLFLRQQCMWDNSVYGTTMHTVTQGKGSRHGEGRVRGEQTRKWTHHQPECRVKHCLGWSQQWHVVTGLENDETGYVFPTGSLKLSVPSKTCHLIFSTYILFKVCKVLSLLIGAFQTPACSLWTSPSQCLHLKAYWDGGGTSQLKISFSSVPKSSSLVSVTL